MEIFERTISPKEMYPTKKIISIDNTIIESCVHEYKSKKEMEKPIVFLFDGNYYILKGHHLMLSASLAGAKMIKVDVIEEAKYPFIKDEEDFKATLENVGLSTLYDFEGIGNFKYEKYPHYYEKVENK